MECGNDLLKLATATLDGTEGQGALMHKTAECVLPPRAHVTSEGFASCSKAVALLRRTQPWNLVCGSVQ